MTAIQTFELTKKYKSRMAVKGLNLTVSQGELFSLLGVNGAGKTTTIKMLSCVLAPTSGDAVLLGESIISNPEAVKAKINLSPQETAVARNLSVQENLQMIAGIYGQDRAEACSSAAAMMALLGLTKSAKDKAKILSGGMQRRLSIAMALISKPQILFLDEPTLGLDVLARRELWSVIREIKKRTTIILTTHYMEEAETLSDRVGIMACGALKAVGTVPELLTQTNTNSLEEAFIALAAETEGKK
ncbi:MAG: ATP-binding cassette domain-containing protein [Candidatus Pelethousia sp.]|nr:ATP-binding cassette domain-containing protein [Candidatus Pelethousia sp.]